MGKEAELLKAVKDKDGAKVQKLLSASIKRKDESLCWQSVDSGHKIRVELKHIDVNVQEPNTGYTPLHLAVLNGSKEIAEKLIFNCADVTAKDVKGNPALHMAVFHGRIDLVELLIFNGAVVNAQNDDRNTALHICCEAAIDHREDIVKKLIKSGAIVWHVNKYHLTPLDVAAMYNRKETVSTLLRYVPTLRDNRTALIEASIRGFQKTVEMLLDCGISCHHLDGIHGSSPLHEAVRYCRTDVVAILLAFQANPDLPNLKKETARSIAEKLPPQIAEKINKLFEDQPNQPIRIPQMLNFSESPSSPSSPRERESFLTHIKEYPELPTDISWTQNRPLYCSSCTEKNPNSNILDGNPRTFWVIPVVHNAWTVLDLHQPHVITGITVYGWNSPQMLKTFQLQISQSIKGPWTTVTSHSCELLGSTDPKEPAFPQHFKGFTFHSRYIRLYLVDNHGGSYICFQGIQLHGASCQVTDALQTCGLLRIADNVIKEGMNTWKKFLDITQAKVDSLVTDPEKKAALWEAVYKGRREMYPLTVLTWLIPPVTCIFLGDIMPDFSVQSDPGVTEVIQIVAQGAVLSGNTCQRLTPNGEGKPSTATFSNISLKPAGMYKILVNGVTTEITLIAPNTTEVRPEVRSENEITSAFDEIQEMLSDMQAALPDD